MSSINRMNKAVIFSLLAVALAFPAWAATVDGDEALDGAPDEAVLSPLAADSAHSADAVDGCKAEVVLPWEGLSPVADGICQCVQDCFYYPDPNPCIAWCCANDWTCRSACY